MTPDHIESIHTRMRVVLCDLFDTVDRALMIADSVGIKRYYLHTDGSAETVWDQIIVEATKRGMEIRLLDEASIYYGKDDRLRKLREELAGVEYALGRAETNILAEIQGLRQEILLNRRMHENLAQRLDLTERHLEETRSMVLAASPLRAKALIIGLAIMYAPQMLFMAYASIHHGWPWTFIVGCTIFILIICLVFFSYSVGLINEPIEPQHEPQHESKQHGD